jgi:hypothetical protein
LKLMKTSLTLGFRSLTSELLAGHALMGLSQEFYAGDADAIGADFADYEFDNIRANANQYVDFSLHISPTDLDVLSEKVAERLQRSPVLLLDSRRSR